MVSTMTRERRSSASATEIVERASPVARATAAAEVAPRSLKIRTMRPSGVAASPSLRRLFNSLLDRIVIGVVPDRLQIGFGPLTPYFVRNRNNSVSRSATTGQADFKTAPRKHG